MLGKDINARPSESNDFERSTPWDSEEQDGSKGERGISLTVSPCVCGAEAVFPESAESCKMVKGLLS